MKTQTEMLDKLIKALGKTPKARVGILGSPTRADNSSLSNAEIGAFHEFGTSKVAKRSFLRMPLITKLQEEIEGTSLLRVDFISGAKSGSLHQFMETLGVLGVGVVMEAFHTGGFGQWQPLAESTISRKGHEQILVDTQSLRDSITSEVIG